jgi:putative selenate reductase
VRNQLGEPDASGRRRPVRIEGSQFRLEADSIILAIGQKSDVFFLDGSAVSLHDDGAIAVDPDTGLAGVEGVYAGGDAVRGPAIIIEACADGRRAAEAVCAQLGLEFAPWPAQAPELSAEEIVRVKRVRASRSAQHKPDMLPVARRGRFDLVEQTLSEEAVRQEAARCFQCATFCDKCVEVCPNRANYTCSVLPLDLTLAKLSCQGGELAVVGQEAFRVEQSRQIIHLDDFCNECGNCATFCVHQGEPYLQKPRLFLEQADFEQERDNAFFVRKDEAGWIIRRREGGREWRLLVNEGLDQGAFEDDNVSLVLSFPEFQIERMSLKTTFEGEFSLVGLAEMYLVLQAVTTSLPLAAPLA